MGNSSSTSSGRRRSRNSPETAAERAKKVIGDLNEGLKQSVKKLDDDHPAAQLIDTVCGGYFDSDKYHHSRSASFYSEDVSEDGSRTVSEDDATYDDRSRRSKMDKSVDSSYMDQSEYDSDRRRKSRHSNSFDTEDTSKHTADEPTTLLSKPLASSFAKRCYFTKSGIGKTTQHYEGLTLTGNVVLMLAAAMKLKGCPTICDEDLRRVEQTYPNQFSRLPDELLLSSGWRRISKYCHFSNKPIPDGVPFFHSKERLHPSGGYYFLLASSVGMVRPLDVEPLTKDTLVLLETDFPTQCDSTPSTLVNEPDQWTLVNKFCFFSGGPINTEEDVYYQADFDGNPIFMLAFLSPSLTPQELYKLGETGENAGLKTMAQVQEVESVYDLTERDFDDLKLYHLGPCRALPQYILQPTAWSKVLPPHFLAARQEAMERAEDFGRSPVPDPQPAISPPEGAEPSPVFSEDTGQFFDSSQASPLPTAEYQREIDEEGAFHGPVSPPGMPPGADSNAMNIATDMPAQQSFQDPETPKLDPPDDEPPSLMKKSMEENPHAKHEKHSEHARSFGEDPQPFDSAPEPFDAALGSQGPIMSPDGEPSVGVSAFFPSGDSEDEDEDTYLETPKSVQHPPEEPFNDFSSPQSFEGTPQGHFPMSPPDEAYPAQSYAAEEKKYGMDEPEPDVFSEFSIDKSQISGLKEGEDDFIDIKRGSYDPGTPRSVASEGSHQSSAMRGAQEILKQNRMRRMELNVKESRSQDDTMSGTGTNPAVSPRDEDSATTWESGSEFTGSQVSGSSVWTDNSANDRSSRRALILQMAKARMKSNKDSPDKSKASRTGSKMSVASHAHDVYAPGDAPDDLTEGNTAEIDIVGDLD